MNLAQMMLKDFVSNPDDNEITVSLIMSQCAVYFGVTIEQMGSSERSHNVVEARQIAMYLCRELTDLSLPKIGQALRPRSHDGHAREQEDFEAHEGETRNLQPCVRAYKSHQAKGQGSIKPARR